MRVSIPEPDGLLDTTDIYSLEARNEIIALNNENYALSFASPPYNFFAFVY